MAESRRINFAAKRNSAALLCAVDLRAGDVLRGICFSLMPGEVLMPLSDVLARSLAPSEIPVSVITSLLGAPLLFLLMCIRRGGASDG